MFKVIIFLNLCIYIINCDKLVCDYKEIKEIQTGNTFTDKYDFCKDKRCVFRLCDKPNSILVEQIVKNKARYICSTLQDFAKLTNKSVDVPVYKSINISHYDPKKLILSKTKLSDFHFIVYKEWRQIRNNTSCILQIKLDPRVQHLLENGELLLLANFNTTISWQGYVVEFLMRQRADGEWVGPELFTKLFIYTTTDDDPMDIRDLYSVIGMTTSCVFMILVLVVYSMFEALRGKYGKMLMAYIACFTFSFAANVIQKLGLYFKWFNLQNIEEGDVLCKYISSIFYFTVMATFFWLNTMSYEIWNTFRPKNKFRTIRSRNQNHEFLFASLYAFGMPLIMLAVLVVINELKLTTVTPQFELCMTNEQSSLFYYIPITIILCVNLVFFVMTSYHIWQQKQDKQHTITSAESRISRRNRNNFGIYLKLSMSTGLNWFLDIIGIFVTPPVALNYIIDTYTLFLGVILFVICVCNRTVLSLLCKRFKINSRFVYQSSVNTAQGSKKSKSRKESNSSSVPNS